MTAKAYFTDHSIDLGPIGAGVNGLLDLGWELDVTSQIGSGFGAQMLAANATPGAGVPEPSGALIACSLGSVLLRRSRKSAASIHAANLRIRTLGP